MILENVSLRPYNTFGIDVTARYFAEVSSVEAFRELDRTQYGHTRILGGGSNVLLTQAVDGLVVKNSIKGREVIKEDDAHVWLKVMPGENWHQLVMYAVESGWGGIENLALIPGTVGAAPIQNIGAYGVEVKDTIESVSALMLDDNSEVTFTNAACRFGYRDSIFKQELKGKVMITGVVFRLAKRPVLNTAYGAIEQELAAMGVGTPDLKAIAQAVIHIRTSKLPDPNVTGNAGSFFKNPTVTQSVYEALLASYPNLPSYPAAAGRIKIPAGWLIEKAGWKGYKRGETGVHPLQALVLCNYGGAKGSDVWQLSADIVQSVQDKFGVTLEREVQVWP